MPVQHKILRGQGAGKWLPFARAKLARLAEECDRARAPHRTRRFVVEAGMVEIKVSVKGWQHYIDIQRKTCPPFLSGFCDLVLHKEGDILLPDVPLTPIYQIDDPDSSDPEDTINVFRRFYPSPATPPADRDWRDEPGLARDQEAAKLMIVSRSSMFSGEMRKVVQVLQGMNVGIPYSPSFALTHGVFVANNGQRWVVEMSNAGVFAWPMEMCRNPIRNAAAAVVLDYTPIATPRPADDDIAAATEAGTFVQLIGAAAMQEFYGKSGPLFAHCGWAFDGDGHKAANLCYFHAGGFTHITTFLYEITITEADNRPSAAALNQVAAGVYHGDRVYAQVKYPNTRGFLESFDPLYGVHTGVISNAPIYTYYDGSARIDVYYENDPFATGNEVFGDEISPVCLPQSILGTERRSGTIAHTATAHFRITGIPTPDAEVRGGTVNYKVWAAELRGQKRVTGGGFGTGSIVGVYAMTLDAGIKLLASTHHYAFIVPYGEREAFYLAQRHVSTVTYSSRSLSLDAVTVQPFFSPVTVCACDSGGEPVISGIGAIEPPTSFCDGEPRVNFLGVSQSDHISPSCYINTYGGTQVLYQNPNAPGGTCGERGGNPGGCSSIPGIYQCVCGHNGGVCPTVTFPAGAVESQTAFSVEFRGSGAARAVFHPVVQDDWFFFLEPGQVQHVVAHRDAFVPTTMVVSPEIDTLLGSELYSTADAYPVSQAGRYHNFIGVP